MLVGGVLAEPRQPRFDRGRLELGRRHARRHSRVVNVDDDREIAFERVPDCYASHGRGL